MKTLRKLGSIALIMVFCMLVQVGCKNNQVDTPMVQSTVNVSNQDSTNTSTDKVEDSEDSEGNAPVSEVIKEGTIEKNGNVILKELAFVYNDKNIAINDIVDDEQLERTLGKADEIKSHTYAIDDGLNMDPLIGFTEKQYKFPGLEIKTIKAPNDEKFYIFQMIITDSKYATIRNIKVGDSVEKLKTAYPEGNLDGNGATNEEDDFRYLPVNYVDGMLAHIKNEVIESIMLYKLLD